MPNFHQIFSKRAEPRCYRDRITPTDEQESALFTARRKIRDQLRREIPRLTEQAFGREGRARPRFRTQGSWAYKTCNQPCHEEQEMDLDYGVYLPVSAWEDSGLQPKAAARTYFDMIEHALKPIVESEGWEFYHGKDTCVRVVLPGIGAHIDVPLYVAPDLEFQRIVEAVLKAVASESVRFAEDRDDDIDEEQWHHFEHIALAMRDGTWKPSDPRKVSDWFEAETRRQNGEQLRRICRYLKGMRDFRWRSGGPTSILLMICASKAWKGNEERDDLALLQVLENIGPIFLGPVVCPQIGEEDFNRLSSEDRAAARAWAVEMAQALKEVIYESRMFALDEAFMKLRGNLDHRFASAPDLVLADNTAPQIRSYPQEAVPQPQHRESRAG